MVDLQCAECRDVRFDALVPRGGPFPACATCGGIMARAWLSAPHVHPDDIPGGVWIEHGLCNADGSPRKYYSKSDMRREAKARGLENVVEHKPDNYSTDKSAHTQRFL
jgi:hypothetical protein